MGNILPNSVPKMLYFSLQNPKIQVVMKMVGCNLGGKNKKTLIALSTTEQPTIVASRSPV
jgi:hypothetical protein